MLVHICNVDKFAWWLFLGKIKIILGLNLRLRVLDVNKHVGWFCGVFLQNLIYPDQPEAQFSFVNQVEATTNLDWLTGIFPRFSTNARLNRSSRVCCTFVPQSRCRYSVLQLLSCLASHNSCTWSSEPIRYSETCISLEMGMVMHVLNICRQENFKI